MNEKKLPFLILILPVLSLFLSMFLFVLVYTLQQRKIVKDNMKYIENLYVKNAINIEKNKIKAAFNIMRSDYEHINDSVKPRLKERVGIAYRIIMNIYENNKNIPKDRLIRIIKQAVCPIRFDNGEGYFFIYNMKGVNILLPPDKKLEGKNLLNVKDASGEYVIRKAVKIAKTEHEGFITWYWHKPVNYKMTKESRQYKKIGYIKYIRPLEWFVGTGVYVKSELYRIEKRFISLFEKEKEKNGEYFMVLRPIGIKKAKILANSNRPYLKGSIIDGQFIDVNGHGYMNEVFDFLNKGEKEGTIGYIYKDNTGLHKEIIFFIFYKKLELLVIYGFNLDNVEFIVKEAEKRYRKAFRKYRADALYLSVSIILIVGVLFLFIARRVNMVFFEYKKEVEEKEEKLERLAMYDNLTGVYNRNKFNEILKYETNMSKRYKTPLSLIMFDLDHFKKVNDEYGHDLGDEVLRMIAKIVLNNIRLTDTFARWGGEEFFLILPKTDIDKAKNIAEGLRVKIESANFKEIGKITCSFGVTSLRENEDEKELIKRADEAMYLAKKKGRNRVEVL